MLELLVGITIAVMLLSIPVSKIDLDKYKVDSFLREFCSDIRYVKKMNQIGNSSVFILVVKQAGKNGYMLFENGGSKKTVFLPQKAELKGSPSKILFNKEGRLREYGNTNKEMTIFLKYNNTYREMTIMPIGGRVLIKEGIYG